MTDTQLPQVYGLSFSITMSPSVSHGLVKSQGAGFTTRQVFGGNVGFMEILFQVGYRGSCTPGFLEPPGNSQQDLGPEMICVMSAPGTRISQSFVPTMCPSPAPALTQVTSMPAPFTCLCQVPISFPSIHGEAQCLPRDLQPSNTSLDLQGPLATPLPSLHLPVTPSPPPSTHSCSPDLHFCSPCAQVHLVSSQMFIQFPLLPSLSTFYKPLV